MPSVITRSCAKAASERDSKRSSKPETHINENSQQPKRESQRTFCRQFLSDQRADVVGLFELEPGSRQGLAQPRFDLVRSARIGSNADEIAIRDLFRLNYAVLKSGMGQRAANFIRCQFVGRRDNEQIAPSEISTEIALTLHE